jgi:TonB-linked SusC/RagA family outer membrane protein
MVFEALCLTKTLRVVKLVTIILLAACLQVSATGYSQITLAEKDAPLQKVFKEIQRQSGYDFLFSVELLQQAGQVTINVQNVSLQQALEACLKDKPLTYAIVEKTVVIKPFPAPVLQSGESPTPSADIHCRVTDSTGAPLEGASVTVKGVKKRGTSTNAKGEFDLKNVDDMATLVISFTGYTSQEIKLNGKTDISIKLIRSTSQLDQVQVIAYGTTTERLSTGNISKVTSETIGQQPVANVLEALEGRVPGLLITQQTGLPGGNYTVQIRGQNSIANGNDPFYVVDGVPYNAQMPFYSQGFQLVNANLGAGSPLNFINPGDIESVEVLKDADATAIYGSRAANGAILITTKKGRPGAMKVDISVKSGFTNPARTIPILTTKPYLAMRQQAFLNDGEAIPSYAYDVNGFWDTTSYQNWPKLLANKPAPYSDAQASVSGGNTSTQYLIGAGYRSQKTGFPTILAGDGGSKTGSMHLNLSNVSPNKKFKVSLTASYLLNKNTVQSNDFTGTALILPPDAPSIYNPDGTLNWDPITPGASGTWTNPYSMLYQKYTMNSNNLISNASLSYSLFRGLDLSSSFGYTTTETSEIRTTPTTFYDPGYQVTSGNSEFQNTSTHSWVIEPQLNYRLALSRGVLTALIGSTFQSGGSSFSQIEANTFISDALLEDIQAAGHYGVINYAAQNRYEAVFGRIGYDWEDKYILNLNARSDGTSRFGSGKQFGNFGDIGAAWIFTKEDFIKNNLKWLSFGKLRGSYGTTGSDQVGDYQFVDIYTPVNFPYENAAGLYPTNLANPLLAWEQTRKLEGSIELGFFQDRVIIQGSFYRNRTNNELVQTPVSEVTGFNQISSNLPALVQNTGAEFSVNTINVRTKDFKWTSLLNLTISRNKLIAFPNLALSPYANTLVIGQPIGVKKLFHEIGVNDTTGVYEFSTVKGQPTYSPGFADEYKLLNLNPKYFGGLQNTFSYKGFSLTIFFQFVNQTGTRFWAAYNFLPGSEHNISPKYLNNVWQKPGDHTEYEKLSQDFGSQAASAFSYAYYSDFAYGNASYIRLKNLALSWQMPAQWIKKAGLTNFSLFVQAQNLLTITKYDGMDPETQKASTGPQRGVVAGLSFGW